MEIVVAVALFLGIVAGVAWAIAAPANARLRRALSYQTEAAARLRDERDLLSRTLKLHDRALEDRDAKLAEANARAALAERTAALCHQGEMAADVEVQRLTALLEQRDDQIDKLQLRVADLELARSAPAGSSDGEDLGDVSDAPPRQVRVEDLPLPEPVREALFGSRVVPAAAIAGDDDCSAMVPAGGAA